MTHDKKTLVSFSIAALSLLAYSAVINCLPPLWAGFHWLYDYLIIPALLACLHRFTGRFDPKIRTACLFSATLLLYGLILSEIFGLGISSAGRLAGILPYSDPFGYLDGAMRLLNAGELSVWTSRRPLATVWLAINLFLSGENLKTALALMALLASIGITCVADSISRWGGVRSGWLTHVLLFFAYRAFVGTTLSEQAGFTLGCVGFALIWNSAAAKDRRNHLTFLTGLLSLSFGLLARAGTFFILPALIAWYTLTARGDRKNMIRRFLASSAVVIFAFAMNSVILRTVGYPDAAFGNFSHTLYGLVHGGDWTRAMIDHPELRTLPEQEMNERIYALSIEQIKEYPSSLLKGVTRAYKDFFFSHRGAYSFIMSALITNTVDFYTFTKGVNNNIWDFLHKTQSLLLFYFFTASSWFVVSSALAFLGLLRLRSIRASYLSLIILSGLGILISAPFIPPWDSSLMRTYVASFPFFILLPASALAQPQGDYALSNNDAPLTIFTLILCLTMAISPFTMRATTNFISKELPPLPSEAAYVKIIPGTILSRNHGIQLSTFLSNLPDTAKRQEIRNIQDAQSLKTSGAIGIGYFHDKKETAYFFWDADCDIPAGKYLAVDRQATKSEYFFKPLLLER